MDLAPDVRTALDAYLGGRPPRADGTAFRRLAGTVWEAGTALPGSAEAVPALIAAFETAGPAHRPHLAVLLGLLAETETETGPGTGPGPGTAPGPGPGRQTDTELTHEAVRRGLPVFLPALRRSGGDGAATAALLYLLGHFPADRAAVLDAAAGLPLDTGDLARLERLLAPPDPADPALGRVWPSPAAWELSAEERELDRAWVKGLPAGQVTALWENDTRSLLSYAGAKALWAAEHGWDGYRPEPGPALPVAPEEERRAAHRTLPSAAKAAALRCPTCLEELAFGPEGARCTGCGAAHPWSGTALDLSCGVGDKTAAMIRNVPLRYDNALRPAFLRLMGENWAGAVSVADEDRYLAERVRPADEDAPVLDLAAGTGRWTSVLAGVVGRDRVIALDLSGAMLERLSSSLPRLTTVRAGALALPFADASLSAVNCWNALQAVPDAAAAIAEVGRCLRPGGTFTLLTFRPAADPLYRYFQTHTQGVIVFEPDALRGMLEEAGMAVRDLSGPGSFLFATAVREDTGVHEKRGAR
ncbi:methyltransferase domain-containing protein [Streptomyces sp. NPDC053750]|uniref:methyltransferase domain-containing protein n=1 Tax=Streptomyces sp. NPDC053750 TaxID=3365714 RepID=UPI0037CEAD72